MCNRLAILASFVVALGIIPVAVVADPNLVCWWKLNDDDSGVIITDYSGYNHDGTLQGGAQFVPGHFDEAVEFALCPFSIE